MEVPSIHAVSFLKPILENGAILNNGRQDTLFDCITEKNIFTNVYGITDNVVIKKGIHNSKKSEVGNFHIAGYNGQTTPLLENSSGLHEQMSTERKISSATTSSDVEYSKENGIGRQTDYYRDSFCHRVLRTSENNKRMINIYSYAATVIIGILVLLISCIVLLLMLYMNSQRKVLNSNQNIGELSPHFNNMRFNGIANGGQHLVSSKDWNFVESLGNQAELIHFTVKQDIHLNRNNPFGYLTGTLDERSIKISGRPKFCHDTDFSAPHELNFKNIKYVHLSDMEDCHHYVYLILNKWNFPNVREIKFERMQIEKPDFDGITKFIDRHNETLNKVEINQSYVCPSPGCDAGMIDFPNHDFQVIITGRRETHKSNSTAFGKSI